jgi:hypothetical protein
MKYEQGKLESEYMKEITDHVGRCLFFGAGSVIRNHVLIDKDSYSILPNTKTKKKQFSYLINDNDCIYSRTTLGYVESLDMFVDSLHVLIDEIK